MFRLVVISLAIISLSYALPIENDAPALVEDPTNLPLTEDSNENSILAAPLEDEDDVDYRYQLGDNSFDYDADDAPALEELSSGVPLTEDSNANSNTAAPQEDEEVDADKKFPRGYNWNDDEAYSEFVKDN